jgi:hypothetical protein
MNKKISKLGLLSLFIATALVSSALTMGQDSAFATKSKKNEAAQGIAQETETLQSSGCFSENGTTLASCNNLDTSINLNLGNNGLGQQ